MNMIKITLTKMVHCYMPKLTTIITFLNLIIPCLSECRSQCGKIPINYPLSIDDGCGAPQFRHMFTCNASSLALFFITLNGNYKVQSIDYKAQTLTVYDPDMSTCTVLQPHHDIHLSDVQYAIIPPSPDTVFALLNCSVDSPVLHRYSFLCFDFGGHKCPELYSSCSSFRVFTTGGLVNPGAGNNTGPNGYFYGGGGGGSGNAGNTSAGFGTGVPSSSGNSNNNDNNNNNNNMGAGPPVGGFGTSLMDHTNDDDYMGSAPPGGGLGGGSSGNNNNIGGEPPGGGFGGGGGNNIGAGPPGGGFGSDGNNMGGGPPGGGFGSGGNNMGGGPPTGGFGGGGNNMGAGPPSDGGGFGTGGNNNMGARPPGGGFGTDTGVSSGVMGTGTPPCCFTGYSTLKVMSMDILDCSHYTSFYDVDKLRGAGPMDWSYGLKFSFSVPDMGCERCTKSGGSCGFDVQTEALLCLCPDSRNSTRQCGNDMDDGRRGMPSIVLQMFIMCLGLLFFFN